MKVYIIIITRNDREYLDHEIFGVYLNEETAKHFKPDDWLGASFSIEEWEVND